MQFKLTNKNPYRDLVNNVNNIARSAMTDAERVKAYSSLYNILKYKLKENEKYLHSSPAFSERCTYWNYRDIKSIKPVRNMKNPWLAFKRQFENAVNNSHNSSYSEVVITVSKELSWFYATAYRNDWVVNKFE